MRILRIGDPHIKINNLEESENLFNFIYETAKQRIVDRIEILGDLTHNHALVRIEILDFWDRWLEKLWNEFDLVAMVGNHDKTGDKNSKLHALKVFKRINKNTNRPLIIDEPVNIGIFSYMPHYHDTELFKKQANELYNLGGRVLVCHQTFDGSQTETGFYAPDGIKQEEILHPVIVGGHIHKEQIAGKVDYPGTPKWDIASDANEHKGIWYYEHDDSTGKVLTRELIPTDKIVTPIMKFIWKEGEEEPQFPDKARVSIELVGSSTWTSKKSTQLKGRASVSKKITDKKQIANRQAGKNFVDFFMNVYETKTNKQELMDFAKELGIV